MLDVICYGMNESRWFNPHKSWIGLGNYDANVLMAALGLHNMEPVWFDGRKSAEQIPFDQVHSIIFNIPTTSFVPFWNGRHWFTVLRRPNGSFVNLDSKLKRPEVIANIQEYAKTVLQNEQNQAILVFEQGKWPDSS
ncbi:unnamed protein product, partial [Mesorhabditis spiculigera]